MQLRNDSIFVHPEDRQTGVGLRMIRMTEKAAEAAGAQMIWGAKPGSPLDLVLSRRHGLERIENIIREDVLMAIGPVAAVVSAVAAAGGVAQGQEAARASRSARQRQGQAQKRAEAQAISQQRKNEQAEARAQRQKPDLAAILASAQAGNTCIGSTDLTSGGGGGPLLLGKSKPGSIALKVADPRSSVHRKRQRKQSLWTDLQPWKQRAQRLSQYFLPFAGRWLADDSNKANSGYNHIYDSTATDALRTLRSGLSMRASSPSVPWMRLATPSPELNEYHSVKVWLQDVSDRMLRVFASQQRLPGPAEDVRGDGPFWDILHVRREAPDQGHPPAPDDVRAVCD